MSNLVRDTVKTAKRVVGNNKSDPDPKDRCSGVIEVEEFTESDFRVIGVDSKLIGCRAHKSEIAFGAVSPSNCKGRLR